MIWKWVKKLEENNEIEDIEIDFKNEKLIILIKKGVEK